MIDQFSTLFTHTDATAYTRTGKIVASDTTGLSAYLQVALTTRLAKVGLWWHATPHSLLLRARVTSPLCLLPLPYLAGPAPPLPSCYSHPQWLKEDILGEYGPLKAELDDQSKFKQKDVERLYKAIEEGEQVVQNAWRKPGSAFTRTQKKMMEIDKLLAKLVTRETASEELFALCFPDAVLIDQYKKVQEDKKAEASEQR